MNDAKPLLLIVLDGWGYSEVVTHNAIAQAKLPTWNKLWQQSPHTLLNASGSEVGLPVGQMGNSEVGHMTIGSGRIIYQDLTLINNAIADGSFKHNSVLLQACATAVYNDSALHVLGLLSPGGVHSHEDQIFALIKLAAEEQVSQIYIHLFLDGRDTPPQSAMTSIRMLQKLCQGYTNVSVASITGRFYAMDRDKRWERTKATLDLLLHNNATFSAPDAVTGLELAYARGETDEFVQPTLITASSIKANDVVVFMNFRADRARQLTSGLLQAEPALAENFVTLTQYDADFPVNVAFQKQSTTNTLGQILAQHHLTQLRIAETEKYAHVTFFFNAGAEDESAGESRVLVPSPKVSTYDQAPAMSTEAITAELVAAIINKSFDVVICNFANADMVGHTGNLAATIEALEVIDRCLAKIIAALEVHGGQMLITADHGNAETMWDPKTNQAHTAHTSNLVPLIYVGKPKITFKSNPPNQHFGLKDIAPTMLDLLGIEKPNEMTGESLLVKI